MERAYLNWISWVQDASDFPNDQITKKQNRLKRRRKSQAYTISKQPGFVLKSLCSAGMVNKRAVVSVVKLLSHRLVTWWRRHLVTLSAWLSSSPAGLYGTPSPKGSSEQREAGRIGREANGVCARLARSLHGAVERATLSTQVPGGQAGSLAGVCLTQRNCGCMKTGDGGRGASPCAVMGSGAEDTEAIHLLVALGAGIFSEKGERLGSPSRLQLVSTHSCLWKPVPGRNRPPSTAGFVGSVCLAFLLPLSRESRIVNRDIRADTGCGVPGTCTSGHF